tara:strand:+ start:1914 stop:2639 length:726 start_codon:yes stop_codon:yes gene_type:complete
LVPIYFSIFVWIDINFYSILIRNLVLLILIFFCLGCEKKQKKQSYLALGDSYTIGEAVSNNDSWPMQLVKALEEENILIDKPKVIAKTGWTTGDLKKGIDEAVLNYPYDWISILIGVNNQSQGKNIEVFKADLEQLISQSILFVGNKKNRLFVISIPDWGKMPFAKNQEREKIATEIDNYNQIIYEVCSRKEVGFIDITQISRTLDSNPHFIGSDSLYPSKSQYAKWVEEIIPFFINSSDD